MLVTGVDTSNNDAYHRYLMSYFRCLNCCHFLICSPLLLNLKQIILRHICIVQEFDGLQDVISMYKDNAYITLNFKSNIGCNYQQGKLV